MIRAATDVIGMATEASTPPPVARGRSRFTLNWQSCAMLSGVVAAVAGVALSILQGVTGCAGLFFYTATLLLGATYLAGQPGDQETLDDLEQVDTDLHAAHESLGTATHSVAAQVKLLQQMNTSLVQELELARTELGFLKKCNSDLKQNVDSLGATEILLKREVSDLERARTMLTPALEEEAEEVHEGQEQVAELQEQVEQLTQQVAVLTQLVATLQNSSEIKQHAAALAQIHQDDEDLATLLRKFSNPSIPRIEVTVSTLSADPDMDELEEGLQALEKKTSSMRNKDTA